MDKFSGKTCKFCNQKFKDGDEVVVCPVCGTPHHRACYNSNGKCVNEELHSNGFRWVPDSLMSEPAVTQSDLVCHRCGNKEPVGTKKCSVCNTPLDNNEFISEETAEKDNNNTNSFMGGFASNEEFRQKLRFGGMSPDDEIDGVKVSLIADYLKTSTFKFLRDFKNISLGLVKFPLNWCAFLFPSIYAFFRKHYVAGIIALIVETVLDIPYVIWNYYDYASVYLNVTSTPPAILGTFVNLCSVLSLAFKIVFMVMFSKSYYKKVIKTCKKEMNSSSEIPIKDRVSVKGGVSLLSGAICMAATVVLTIVIVFITGKYI